MVAQFFDTSHSKFRDLLIEASRDVEEETLKFQDDLIAKGSILDGTYRVGYTGTALRLTEKVLELCHLIYLGVIHSEDNEVATNKKFSLARYKRQVNTLIQKTEIQVKARQTSGENIQDIKKLFLILREKFNELNNFLPRKRKSKQQIGNQVTKKLKLN